MRAEPDICFGGPVAEETSNLCYTFGMADDKEPVKKTLMASSSAVITSQDSVSNNLVTIMVDTRASSHEFDDAIIRDPKHRLQYGVYLATPRKILPVGGALLDGTAEGVLQGLVTDDNGNQFLTRVNSVGLPGIGRNLFSVMASVKKALWLSSATKPQAGGIQRHRAAMERE